MRYFTTLFDEKQEIRIEEAPDGRFEIELGGETYQVDSEFIYENLYLSLLIDGKSYSVETRRGDSPGQWLTRFGPDFLEVTVRDDLEERAAQKRAEEAASGPSTVRSPMPGVVIRVTVEPGQVVEEGQTVAIVEAMKMQNELAADRPGRIGEVFVTAGNALETRAPILTILPDEKDDT